MEDRGEDQVAVVVVEEALAVVDLAVHLAVGEDLEGWEEAPTTPATNTH